MDELKPCPFCGSATAPYLYHDTDCNMYYVFCDNCEGDGCGASGAQYFDPKLASECWNTRKILDEKKQRIQAIYDDGGTYDDLEALSEIVKIVMDDGINK